MSFHFMRSDYYAAVTYDGGIYCLDCLPKGVTEEDEEVFPVFPDSEWSYVPDCDTCGELHHYVNVLEEAGS